MCHGVERRSENETPAWGPILARELLAHNAGCFRLCQLVGRRWDSVLGLLSA